MWIVSTLLHLIPHRQRLKLLLCKRKRFLELNAVSIPFFHIYSAISTSCTMAWTSYLTICQRSIRSTCRYQMVLQTSYRKIFLVRNKDSEHWVGTIIMRRNTTITLVSTTISRSIFPSTSPSIRIQLELRSLLIPIRRKTMRFQMLATVWREFICRIF